MGLLENSAQKIERCSPATEVAPAPAGLSAEGNYDPGAFVPRGHNLAALAIAGDKSSFIKYLFFIQQP